MKRLIASILVLSLFLLLPACAAANQPVTDLKALEKEVADACARREGKDNFRVQYFRYYGTDNGYHIVCIKDLDVVVCSFIYVTIAGSKFQQGDGEYLLAYRNGKIIELRTAYFFRLVSKDAITKAAELHAEKKNATE